MNMGDVRTQVDIQGEKLVVKASPTRGIPFSHLIVILLETFVYCQPLSNIGRINPNSRKTENGNPSDRPMLENVQNFESLPFPKNQSKRSRFFEI